MTAEDKIAALHQQIEERGHLQAKIWTLRQRIAELDRHGACLFATYRELIEPLREEIALFELYGRRGAAERPEKIRIIRQADACLAEAKWAGIAEKREIEEEIERLHAQIEKLS